MKWFLQGSVPSELNEQARDGAYFPPENNHLDKGIRSVKFLWGY